MGKRSKFRDYVITARKEMLARPGALLVDDFALFADLFKAVGGEVDLLPQVWNENHGVEDKVGFALNRVEE